MTPRERIMAAMRHEPVDVLPCSIYFNANLRAGGHDCSTAEGRLHLALELGTDPFLYLPLFSQRYHSDVRVSNWVEERDGEPYPVLWQAWETPAGCLTQAVRMAPECGRWTAIRWCDESASALVKPLIEGPEDVEAFAYLVPPLEDMQAQQLLGNPALHHVMDLAREAQAPTVATYGQGLATLMFTMGAEHAVYFAVDHPEAFDRLAELIHQRELRNIDLAMRAGADILKRFGGYEMTNFYNPDIWRRVCRPRLKKEVDRAHEAGLLIFYRVVTGMEPLLDDIAELGFDCIEGGEPRLSGCSLARWHQAFEGKSASWTGISTPVLLGGSDPEAVRREVRYCVDIFGKRGFILGVTNSIREHFPWKNTLAMIEEWKQRR